MLANASNNPPEERQRECSILYTEKGSFAAATDLEDKKTDFERKAKEFHNPRKVRGVG